MDIREVLVSVECDVGRGGVVRADDGHVWLSWSVERLGGPRLDDHQPAQLGLRDDRTLLGGRLAPGAVAAEAVDDRGRRIPAAVANGAWAVVLEQPIRGPVPTVCCRDAKGRPVAPALPASWTRAPVTDTDEPCPACGAVAWDEVRPDDESRGSRGTSNGGTEPTPIAVCRVCGHEESIGSAMRFESGDEDSAEVAERIRAWEASHRAEQREMLRQVDFPIYAAIGWAAKLTGHGGSSAGLGGPLTRVETVTVSHGAARRDEVPELQIETAIAERARHQSESTLAREALQRWLFDNHDESSPRSDAAFVLGLRGRERERRGLAALAEVTDRLIGIDGSPQPFRYIEANGRWAAVRCIDTLTITITARAADPAKLMLMPVTNPPVDLFDADTD